MTASFLIGRKIPDVALAALEDGNVVPVSAQKLFAGQRSIVIGVPGAFTPVCSRQHVPDFVKNADRLLASGFTQLVCIVANDPFVVDKWSMMLDPEGKIRFMADGNLAFTRAVGMISHERDLHLGERSNRYMMRVDDGMITYVKVEPSVLVFTCTRAQDAIDSTHAVKSAA